MKTKELRKYLDRHPVETLGLLLKRSGLLVLGVTFVVCIMLAVTPTATKYPRLGYFSSPSGIKLEKAIAEANRAIADRFDYEKNIFYGLSAPLLNRAKRIDSQLARSGQQTAFFINPDTQLSVIEGLVSLSYLVAVGVRFLIFLPLISFAAGWALPEILQSGNSYDLLSLLSKRGRLFYSGINLQFSSDTQQQQVPNLLALSSVKKSTVKRSQIYRTLLEFGVDSPATRELVGHLLYYRATPFSIKNGREVSIVDWANSTLIATLTAQQGTTTGTSPLQADLNKALTKTLREALEREVTPHSLAVTVLLVAASKILTFEQLNQTWVQVSAHPDLQARAILGSLKTFTRDCSTTDRDSIRQALYYSSRSTLGSLNNFPADTPAKTLALRQVVEQLFITDSEKRTAEATVSRFLNLRDGLLAVWQTQFIEEAVYSPFKKCILTTEDILFAPLELITSIFRQIEGALAIKEAYLQAQTVKATWSSKIPPHWQSIPLIQSRQSALATAKTHSLEPAEMACWTVVEPVLRSASWIETFVSGQPVPAGSLCAESFNGTLRKALVPINVDKLSSTVGDAPDWRSQFIEVTADSKARANTNHYREPKRAFMRRVK